MLIQLQQYLINAAKKTPEKIALIFNTQRYSYHAIHVISNKLAHALWELGVKRGDRIVVYLGNIPETIIAFWAILKVDAVAIIVNPDQKFESLFYILNDSDATICFMKTCDSIFLGKLSHLPYLKKIITLDSKDNQNKFLIEYTQLINSQSNFDLISKNIDLDLSAIIYTSGSTGESKGVVLTHRNMLLASQSINSYLKNTKNDIIICALPLSFDYGLYQMIMAFSVGATLVLEPDLLLPFNFLKKINDEKVTAVPGVPTLFSLLALNYQVKKYAFTQVRYVTNTGAALTKKHIDHIKNIFPEAKIYSMYGLTECKRCTYLPPEDIGHKPNSVGIAIPNTEIFVVDEKGGRLPPRTVGQLVVRGGTIMSGYWKKQAMTAEKLRDGLLPLEKILYTGDYGFMDEENYFYFCGRMDEVIKSRGIKINPKEVEDIIAEIPGVNEVAIIAVSDEVLGQALHAFVSCTANQIINEEIIFMRCREKMDKNKIPKYVSIISSLPKFSNGKINKNALHLMTECN